MKIEQKFFDGITQMDDFDLINFLFASKSRLNVLLSLYDSSKSMKQLEDEFGKKHSNISRNINELKKFKLVTRLHDKRYAITSLGFLVVKNLKNLVDDYEHIDSLEDFWKCHSIDFIPDFVLKKLTLFNDSKLVKSSVMEIDKPLNTYMENLKKSTQICMILPVYSNNIMTSIYDTLTGHEGHLDLITTREIYEKIIESDLRGHFTSLVKNGSIQYHIVESLNVFFTVSETFISLFLFFDDEIFDNSQMLITRGESTINDGYRLFRAYKNHLIK